MCKKEKDMENLNVTETPKEETKSVEQMFQQLNTVISTLEGENITLEQSFTLYKEGMDLVQACTHAIDGIQKKVQILNQNGEIDEL